MKRSLTGAVLFMFVISVPIALNADTLQYRFQGVLPTGSTSHTQVSDGESFTAIFNIDTSVEDADPQSSFGIFPGAVIGGELKFSGGYISPLSFAGFDVTVLDNWDAPDFVDGVAVHSSLADIWFLASNYDDLTTLTADSLPDIGTSFNSAPDPIPFNVPQFVYFDDKGTISYNGQMANNISFAAIPEPSTAVCLVFGCIVTVICSRGRFKSR